MRSMRQNIKSNVHPDEKRPVADIRESNIRKILLYLRHSKILSRQDLCDQCALTGAGLSRNIHKLLNAGLIIEEPESISTGRLGRRRSYLSINPCGAYVLGITVAHNRKSVAIMNAVGVIIAERELFNLELNDPSAAFSILVNNAHELIEDSGLKFNQILGAGMVIGIPDAVITETSSKINSPSLGWKDVQVFDLIRSKTSIQFRIVSRAESLLQVEIQKLALAKTGQKYLLINCGVGLGAAFQIIGHGPHDNMSPPIQISHIVTSDDNTICYCGRRGCLEQVGGGASIVRQLRNINPNTNVDFHKANEYLNEAFSAAKAGNESVKQAFFDAGKRFAKGIDLASSILISDQVFIAGEVGRQSDYVEGVFAGLAEIKSTLTTKRVAICNTRSAYAAGVFALNKFLFSDDFRLEKLKRIERAAS